MLILQALLISSVGIYIIISYVMMWEWAHHLAEDYFINHECEVLLVVFMLWLVAPLSFYPVRRYAIELDMVDIRPFWPGDRAVHVRAE